MNGRDKGGEGGLKGMGRKGRLGRGGRGRGGRGRVVEGEVCAPYLQVLATPLELSPLMVHFSSKLDLYRAIPSAVIGRRLTR